MAFDRYTTLKFTREARVLRVTIDGNGATAARSSGRN